MIKVIFSEFYYLEKKANFDECIFFVQSIEGDINLGNDLAIKLNGSNIKCETIRSELKAARYEYNRHVFAWCVIEESDDKKQVEGIYDSVSEIPASCLANLILNFQRYFFEKHNIVQSIDKEYLANHVENIENIAMEIKEKLTNFTLNEEEKDDIVRYVLLKKSIGATEQKDVNIRIESDKQWDQFKAIRALNDHGTGSRIPGISKKAFAAIESVAGSLRGSGNPLISSEHY